MARLLRQRQTHNGDPLAAGAEHHCALAIQGHAGASCLRTRSRRAELTLRRARGRPPEVGGSLALRAKAMTTAASPFIALLAPATLVTRCFQLSLREAGLDLDHPHSPTLRRRPSVPSGRVTIANPRASVASGLAVFNVLTARLSRCSLLAKYPLDSVRARRSRAQPLLLRARYSFHAWRKRESNPSCRTRYSRPGDPASAAPAVRTGRPRDSRSLCTVARTEFASRCSRSSSLRTCCASRSPGCASFNRCAALSNSRRDRPYLATHPTRQSLLELIQLLRLLRKSHAGMHELHSAQSALSKRALTERSSRRMHALMRSAVRASASRHALRSGATSSAAPEGVGARASATKSAMVKSISCPIPDTTGIGRRADRARDALIIETTTGPRSSRHRARRSARRTPPARRRSATPRQSRARQRHPARASDKSARKPAENAVPEYAAHRESQRRTATSRHRCAAGNRGRLRLRSRANSPSAASFTLRRSNSRFSAPTPASSMCSTMS